MKTYQESWASEYVRKCIYGMSCLSSWEFGGLSRYCQQNSEDSTRIKQGNSSSGIEEGNQCLGVNGVW